jgi:hypothetical protein
MTTEPFDHGHIRLQGVHAVAVEVARRLAEHPDKAVGIRPAGVLLPPHEFATHVRQAVELLLSQLVDMEAAGDGEYLLQIRREIAA